MRGPAPILWLVYPLGFTGAPIRPDELPDAPIHRLAHLERWLDYAVELGVTGLQLGPIFASRSHGYDTLDHFRIDPRLGDDSDFDSLVTAAHARGLDIVLDGVFNHVHRSHPLARPGATVFEGHADLVELDHTADEVVELVTDVMLHWLRRGADGWRLDAAYAVNPDFWARVLPRVRAQFPDVWVVGEVIHGDYADIVRRSGMDSVTQYELWHAAWSSIHTRNYWELAWTLGRHNTFLDSFVPQTFIGNHDVTRIAERLGDDGAVLAAVLLFTVGGLPTVYYGDEQAFRGEKFERAGGDDAIRPVFPAQPGDLCPAGWWMFGVYRELIALRRRHPWLAQARTETLELANERLVYAAVNPGGAERLRVELDMVAMRATVTGTHGAEFTWTGHRAPAAA